MMINIVTILLRSSFVLIVSIGIYDINGFYKLPVGFINVINGFYTLIFITNFHTPTTKLRMSTIDYSTSLVESSIFHYPFQQPSKSLSAGTRQLSQTYLPHAVSEHSTIIASTDTTLI